MSSAGPGSARSRGPTTPRSASRRGTGTTAGPPTSGVTGTTITLDYRAASTPQLAELYALVPPAVIGTNTEEVATLQAYINTFNKDFELYGRHVVLKAFQGKGDFIDEDLGEDQTQAEEDAVTVASTSKSFADVSLVDSSAVYSTDLAAQKVIASSLYENTQTWYAAVRAVGVHARAQLHQERRGHGRHLGQAAGRAPGQPGRHSHPAEARPGSTA